VLEADESSSGAADPEPMSTTLATFIGLLPFASLSGVLVWLSRL
jgi:hypothetical protein